jgi:hypothetical protein
MMPMSTGANSHLDLPVMTTIPFSFCLWLLLAYADRFAQSRNASNSRIGVDKPRRPWHKMPSLKMSLSK